MANALMESELSVPELEQLIEKKKKGISRLIRKRAKLQAEIDVLDVKIRDAGGNSMTGGARTTNDSSLVEVIADVLGKAESGVRVKDIVERVLASGYRTESLNFRSIINQALIKDERFVASRRGVYTLKK